MDLHEHPGSKSIKLKDPPVKGLLSPDSRMDETKEIVLTVPSSFHIPLFLARATPAQTEQALQLADLLLETGLSFRDDSEKKHLKNQIHQLQATTVESVREEAVRIARSELRAEVHGKDALLGELRRQAEDLRHRLEELKHEKATLTTKLAAKEEKVDALQEKLQQRIAVQSNSSKRGAEGERDFQILSSNLKNWTLESVGKTKESTDFRAILHTLEVRFEVKNHETDVPYTKNVDKFERDMKQHPATKVGVFVALTARIEKMEDSISIRWTDDKQLLVFIPCFLSRDLSYTYDMIESFIKTMKYMKPFLESKDSSKDVELLTEKITSTVLTIQHLDKQITDMSKDHHEYSVKTTANYKALQSLVLSALSSLTGKDQEDIKPKAKRKSKKKTLEESSE